PPPNSASCIPEIPRLSLSRPCSLFLCKFPATSPIHRRPSCIIPPSVKNCSNLPPSQYFLLLRSARVAWLRVRTDCGRGNLACCRPPTLVDFETSHSGNRLFGQRIIW